MGDSATKPTLLLSVTEGQCGSLPDVDSALYAPFLMLILLFALYTTELAGGAVLLSGSAD